MDSNDVRNRFRSNGRRDYVGPMPKRKPAQKPTRSAPQRVQYSKVDEEFFVPETPPKKQKSKRSKKKVLIILFFIILLICGGVAIWKLIVNKEKPVNNEVQATEQSQNNEKPAASQPKTIRFVATGDMIAHDAILNQAKKDDGTYDFTPMLANMKPFFDKSDVSFCNQATPAGGPSFGFTGYPIFNAPIEWPRAIEGVGCNVINIGTNHTNDKGQDLVNATVDAWDGRDVLAVVGANRNAQEQSEIRYFEKDGVKFAVFSYSTYSNSPITNGYAINMYDSSRAKQDISNARKNADVVIVSMRWGTEYSPDINAQQDQIAQELASNGADIVIGHGPHFLEPVKKLSGLNGRSTYVWFSLGNFLNTQLETEALIGGFAIMDIDSVTKTVSDVSFMPVYSHYEWTAAQKAANDLLSRKNIALYPLDQSAGVLSKSLLGTTVEAQTDRVTKLLNQYTKVPIIKSSQF